jgi:hypothetical protein
MRHVTTLRRLGLISRDRLSLRPTCNTKFRNGDSIEAMTSIPFRTYDNELTRFLSFVVLGVSGFIGEAQLALAAHTFAFNWDPQRWILVISVLLAGLLSGWGFIAASESFVRIAHHESQMKEERPVRLPVIPAFGAQVQAAMVSGVKSNSRRLGIMDLGAIGILGLLGLLFFYAML